MVRISTWRRVNQLPAARSCSFCRFWKRGIIIAITSFFRRCNRRKVVDQLVQGGLPPLLAARSEPKRHSGAGGAARDHRVLMCHVPRVTAPFLTGFTDALGGHIIMYKRSSALQHI